jgi:methylenetetrahydrofolate reductase (NADPH)
VSDTLRDAFATAVRDGFPTGERLVAGAGRRRASSPPEVDPMLSLLRKLWPFGTEAPGVVDAAVRDLVRRLHLELVPLASADQAIADLPAGSEVSVTCSPVKGIAATRALTERLLAAGHVPVPHLAARMVTGPDEVAELAAWLRSNGLAEVFVIAGDAPTPAGPYDGALGFVADLLAASPGVERVGVAGYPDGHALIDRGVLHEQLHAKQALLAEHGIDGWVSTQMCFDAPTVRTWIEAERAAGLALPIRLGVPGVVDRTRLMSMGVRLGIGASLRYLAKNRATVLSMVAPGGYDPTELVVDLGSDAPALGIESLHCFTFNSVADTVAWRDALLADPTA